MRSRLTIRRGAAALEAAIVLPVVMLMLLFLVQGGIAIFRWHQITAQAREAARYACVHGYDWALETQKSSPTESEIYAAAVLPFAASMDTANLSCKIEWIDERTGAATSWDSSTKKVTALGASGEPMNHRVRVTITYKGAEILPVGALTLTSTTELPMAF